MPNHGRNDKSYDKHCCNVCLQEAFVTSEEFGQDLEHVEVLQKKFDEFQKDLQNHEDKVRHIHRDMGAKFI